ncbi:hypothetical protein KO465_02230 [Candidatus Micrarchaeota archaeon]|jgi:hypothetical protein|nr:hypothetical protein [Candidatus Micrarchaeota archaeon]
MKTKLVSIVEHYMKLLESIENDPSLSDEEKSLMKTNALEKADKEILNNFSNSKEIKPCPKID